jgi:hypothetical protein
MDTKTNDPQIGGVHTEPRVLDTAKIDTAIKAMHQARDFDAKLQAVRTYLPEVAPLVDDLLKAAPWQERQSAA